MHRIGGDDEPATPVRTNLIENIGEIIIRAAQSTYNLNYSL